MKKKVKEKKSRVIPTKYIFLAIFLTWIIGLILGLITEKVLDSVVRDSVKNRNLLKYFYTILTFLVLSIMFAFPTAMSLTKRANKIVIPVNDNLEKIANGNFECKIDYVSNNQYIRELINNFNKMVDELNSVSIMRKDFISSFSHEFKTPISSIKGYAEIIRDDGSLLDEDQEYVKIIISECNRLLNLADKTMFISRINSDTLNIDRKIFSLTGQIEEAVLILDNSFKQKKLEVYCDLDRVKIKADRNLIKQVWINLLENAIKFTNNNGIIQISCKKENEECIVKISDNGIGMDDEEIKKVFEKYYQVDKSHSRIGVGLGLSLCKKIVEIFQGTISCESKKGVGTTFIVTLPLLEEK